MGGEKKKKGNGRATITTEQSVNPIIIAKNLIWLNLFVVLAGWAHYWLQMNLLILDAFPSINLFAVTVLLDKDSSTLTR